MMVELDRVTPRPELHVRYPIGRRLAGMLMRSDRHATQRAPEDVSFARARDGVWLTWASRSVAHSRRAAANPSPAWQALGVTHLNQLVGGSFEGSRSKPEPRLAGSPKFTALSTCMRSGRHAPYNCSRGFILCAGAWRGVTNLNQ